MGLSDVWQVWLHLEVEESVISKIGSTDDPCPDCGEEGGWDVIPHLGACYCKVCGREQRIPDLGPSQELIDKVWEENEDDDN